MNIIKHTENYNIKIQMKYNKESKKYIQLIIELDQNTDKKVLGITKLRKNNWYYICVKSVLNLINEDKDNLILGDEIMCYFSKLNEKLPFISFPSKDTLYTLDTIKSFIDGYKATTIGTAMIKAAITSVYFDRLARELLNFRDTDMHIEIDDGDSSRVYEAQEIEFFGGYHVHEVYSFNGNYINNWLDDFKYYGTFQSRLIFERFVKPLNGIKNIDNKLLDEYLTKLKVIDSVYAENSIEIAAKYVRQVTPTGISFVFPASYLSLTYKEIVYEDKFKALLDYTLANEINSDLRVFFE